MNRYLTSLTALALLAACQDSTAPRPEAPEQGGLAPDAIAPSLEPAGAEASLTARHLWAVVNQNGTLARGSRVTAVTWLGTGRYEVTFDRNVTGCAYIATTRNAYSQALGVYTAVPTLFLANDHTGHTELASLFVDEQFRHGRSGPLIAKSRSCSVASVAPPRTDVMGPKTRSKIHDST